MYFNIFGDSFLTCSSKIHTDNETGKQSIRVQRFEGDIKPLNAAPKAGNKSIIPLRMKIAVITGYFRYLART